MWRWIHAGLLLKGQDLCTLTEMDARDFFDLVDQLFVEDALRNGELDGGLEKARASLDKVYSRTSYTLQSTSGGSNDDAGEDYGPYGPTTPRDPQPHRGLIEPSDNGYPGLEAPVG